MDAMAEPLSSCFTVGKTSLITRFMYDSFDNTYQVRSWAPLPCHHPWCLQLGQLPGDYAGLPLGLANAEMRVGPSRGPGHSFCC